VDKPFAFTQPPGTNYKRVINLSAGCAALPLEVLEKAARELVDTESTGCSVAEMGYRTKNFHVLMERAEESFRQLMEVPDTHALHFFNGGATLQFAALPMNLLSRHGDTADYIMNGHWSEKARNEAAMYASINEVTNDPKGTYFSLPDAKQWNFSKDAKYIHYTAADTRQGFEFNRFPYEALPEGSVLCCDASANFGSKRVDISKYGVIYAASHKNFSTSGVCYTMIRKDLIPETPLPMTPTMCNWNKFETAPNRIYNVPIIFSVYMGNLVCEWMLERGGVEYFDDLAQRRSNILYDLIDNSGGFYNTFVTEDAFRSRMQVVFTIGDGTSMRNQELVEKFLQETNDELGWLDIRSHPLGIPSDAIRVTMYNPQSIETVQTVRDYMNDFMKRMR
jgi:phosphoserine aminotransferase